MQLIVVEFIFSIVLNQVNVIIYFLLALVIIVLLHKVFFTIFYC